MPDSKITDLPSLTTPTDNDVTVIVDVLDTTQSPTGTDKKLSWVNIKNALNNYFSGIYLGLHSKADTAGSADTATTAGNLSGTPALPNGTTATTQTQSDNSTKLATTAYVDTDTKVLSGWIPSEAATYVSQDGSTGVFNIASDVTGKYSSGMRYKYTQSQALTAYWSFDTNSNSDVGSFNGTDTNMSYTAGKFGNAATFNGTTSKIVIADNASLKPTGEFTIGCWLISSTKGRTLFQSYSQNTSVAGFQTTTNASSGVIECVIGKNTGTTAGTDYSAHSAKTNVCDGTWHYVVYSFRNNYLQIYVDGKLDYSSYSLAPAYAATNYVRIGVYNTTGSDSQFWNGQIDDLFLINGYALDEATIKAKYADATAQGTGAITVQKYGLITAVGAYSGGVTPITIWGGTDYSLQNATISNPFYSTVSEPFGFDRRPAKWTVEVSDNVSTHRTQSSPAQNTWYNLGSIQISVPIGSWNVYKKVMAGVVTNNTTGVVTGDIFTTLSTANNTESDIRVTDGNYLTWYISANSGLMLMTQSSSNPFSFSSKTTLYLNTRTDLASMVTIGNYCGSTPTIIRAVSTLL